MNWKSFKQDQILDACLQFIFETLQSFFIHERISACWVILLSRAINFGVKLQAINQLDKEKNEIIIVSKL